MLKRPKEKGRRHELRIAELLRGYGYKAFRTPLSGGIDSWKGDITSKKFPLFVECKNTEKTDFIGWYKKAEGECGTKPPIIIWTKNREDIYVFLLFTDFMTILTQSTASNLKQEFPKKTEKPKKIVDSKLKFNKAHSARRKK